MKARRDDLPEELRDREAKQRVAMKILVDLFPGEGLALMTFDLSAEGHMTWISNADRRDMVKALRELADQLEIGLGDTAGREV